MSTDAAVHAPLQPWRSVKLRLHETVEGYRQALDSKSYLISGPPGNFKKILLQLEISPEPVELSLGLVSVQELGFTSATRWAEIRERAAQLGYVFCPAEVGFALRLQHLEHPEHPLLEIPTSVSDHRGRYIGFGLSKYSHGLIFDPYYAHPDVQRQPKRTLVFLQK